MRGYLFQLPLLVAASASAHLISIDMPTGQKGLQEGLATGTSCHWDGTAPFCRGSCESPYVERSKSECGDGACCLTGSKRYCCLDTSTVDLASLEAGPGKVIKGLDLNIADDPYDDICPQGKHVLCPPGADRNNDCECVDDKAGKRNHQMKSVL